MSMEVYIVLHLLLIKHFLADFPLQTEYMLRKGAPTGWILPLLTHAAVHAGLTMVVMAFFVDWTLVPLLGAIDFLAHTFIDTWKARLAKYPTSDKRFWTSLGFDQLLHGITYLQITYLAS